MKENKTKKQMTQYLFYLSLIVLSIGSSIWLIIFFDTLKSYQDYYNLANNQGTNSPLPFYLWESGKNINIIFIGLSFIWFLFIEYSLRKKVYPFLKQKITYLEIKRTSRSISRLLYKSIYDLIFGYFSKINQKVGVRIEYWFMKIETFEHVTLLIKVFRWIVLPLSVIYSCVMFIFLNQNVLNSLLLGVLLYFYSNFVPDLPAIFRRKFFSKKDSFQNLSWYKTYALLLFAPLFIFCVFCGKTIKWQPTETFHNFKSLIIYGVFLFLFSLLAFLIFPLSLANVIESLFLPIFGILGYLIHLRVDLIF